MKPRLSIAIIMTFISAGLAFSADKLPQAGSNLGSVQGGDFKLAHSIINKKCTKCHTKDKIDSALISGKDMFKIQKQMEKRGALLNSNEREVLGIYWKQSNPLLAK